MPRRLKLIHSNLTHTYILAHIVVLRLNDAYLLQRDRLKQFYINFNGLNASNY